jgi:ribose-phosphate pyrophosphokinase
MQVNRGSEELMGPHPLALFTLAGTDDYARRLAARLETPLSPVEERNFEDGEHKIRPLVPVEGTDAYVIHALHGDETHSVNDKLCRLLFLIGTLKDHGAARVTAVLPYLCYARKDRRTQPYDPVTQRYVAALFEAVGTDRVMAVEVHNVAAFENAFNCSTRHIETAELFAEHFAQMARKGKIVAVSPDAGGVKRVEQFRRALEGKSAQPIDNAFVEKYRSGGVVTGGALVGGVEGKTAIILDDLISTGNTLLRAARACRAAGASRVFAAAAHGLFVGGAVDLFGSRDLDGLVIADTVALPATIPQAARDRTTVLDSTALIIAAIGSARGER